MWSRKTLFSCLLRAYFSHLSYMKLKRSGSGERELLEVIEIWEREVLEVIEVIDIREREAGSNGSYRSY